MGRERSSWWRWTHVIFPIFCEMKLSVFGFLALSRGFVLGATLKRIRIHSKTDPDPSKMDPGSVLEWVRIRIRFIRMALKSLVYSFLVFVTGCPKKPPETKMDYFAVPGITLVFFVPTRCAEHIQRCSARRVGPEHHQGCARNRAIVHILPRSVFGPHSVSRLIQAWRTFLQL